MCTTDLGNGLNPPLDFWLRNQIEGWYGLVGFLKGATCSKQDDSQRTRMKDDETMRSRALQFAQFLTGLVALSSGKGFAVLISSL